MVERQRIFSIPNMLSMPDWLWCRSCDAGLSANAQAFLAILAISLLSDVFDGYLARRLNQPPDLVRKLDSWGDVLTYGGYDSGSLLDLACSVF